MTEEKKEETKKPDEVPPAAVTPQAEAAPAPAPAATGEAQATPPAKEEKKAVKIEKPSNCAGCNKSIKKKRWYYRNGKFYCTHRCWKSALKKEAKPEEAKA